MVVLPDFRLRQPRRPRQLAPRSRNSCRNPFSAASVLFSVPIEQRNTCANSACRARVSRPSLRQRRFKTRGEAFRTKTLSCERMSHDEINQQPIHVIYVARSTNSSVWHVSASCDLRVPRIIRLSSAVVRQLDRSTTNQSNYGADLEWLRCGDDGDAATDRIQNLRFLIPMAAT